MRLHTAFLFPIYAVGADHSRRSLEPTELTLHLQPHRKLGVCDILSAQQHPVTPLRADLEVQPSYADLQEQSELLVPR